MSEHDRGAYTPPTDEPLSFDARRPQGRRPMPMTLVASVIVLAVLAVAVVLFYRSGVRGANETPQVVGEPMLAIKEAPPAESQPVDEAAELQVYADAGQGAPASPTFAPPPEQPRPRPTAPATGAPVQSAPVALPPAPTPAPKAAPAQPALRPSQPAAVAGEPVASRPVQTAAAEVPAAQPNTPVATGGAAVQIGAFASTAVADAEFRKVAAAFGSYTAGKAKRVEPVERNGSTLYRTAFTGFTRADAQAFCQALKASGRDCLVR
jgi:hypothetical protein